MLQALCATALCRASGLASGLSRSALIGSSCGHPADDSRRDFAATASSSAARAIPLGRNYDPSARAILSLVACALFELLRREGSACADAMRAFVCL